MCPGRNSEVRLDHVKHVPEPCILYNRGVSSAAMNFAIAALLSLAIRESAAYCCLKAVGRSGCRFLFSPNWNFRVMFAEMSSHITRIATQTISNDQSLHVVDVISTTRW
jgi:hypothetical protein